MKSATGKPGRLPRTAAFLSAAALGIAGLVAAPGCGKLDVSEITGSKTDSSPVQLRIDANAVRLPPQSKLTLTISATDQSGAPANTEVKLTASPLGHVDPLTVKTVNGTAQATFTAGTQPGEATVEATRGSSRHVLTLTIDPKAPVPAPGAPAPAPAPGGATDALNPSQVSWDEPAGDVGAWPITAKIVYAEINSERVVVNREYLGRPWPSIQEEGWSKPSIGNWWVIGKCADGRWHAATIDWLGEGKTSMEKPYFNGNDDIHGCLATDWRPRRGETAYVMQSTHARSGVLHNNKQRTNIYQVTMP